MGILISFGYGIEQKYIDSADRNAIHTQLFGGLTVPAIFTIHSDVNVVGKKAAAMRRYAGQPHPAKVLFTGDLTPERFHKAWHDSDIACVIVPWSVRKEASTPLHAKLESLRDRVRDIYQIWTSDTYYKLIQVGGFTTSLEESETVDMAIWIGLDSQDTIGDWLGVKYKALMDALSDSETLPWLHQVCKSFRPYAFVSF